MSATETDTDLQLLARYTQHHAEDAFAEIVRRHLDLVHSAALRQVRSPQLAEEVAQSAFTDLAHNSAKLRPDTILTAWLYQVTRRTAIDVVRREARRQLREQIATEMNAMNASGTGVSPVWSEIEPLLDEAMSALDDTDRAAVLLRYFENQSLREVGQQLGTSDDAAQKRVSRAIEKLREFFTKRGVTVGASGLVVFLSANAVQAAPAGLAVTISTAATVAGTSLLTTAAATNAIVMTTLQKTIIGAALIATIATGIYEARQVSNLRGQIQTLEQSRSPLTAQIQQLQRERDDATNRLVALNDELARWKSEQKQAELLKLRGQVGTLRQQLASTAEQSNSPSSGFAKMMSDPAMREYIHQAMVDLIKRRYGTMFQELKLTPEQIEKFTELVSTTFQDGAQRLAAAQSGAPGPTQPGQAGANMMSGLQEQLVSVLGESGAARFKEYTQEVPARTTVDLLNVQLGANKLSDEQGANLFKLVKAEPFDLTHGISGDLDQAFAGSQADIDDHLAKVAESNQRVVQQADSFLSADQLAALTAVLSNGITARITQGAAFRPKP